ncbi:hypothetical protein BOX15_Mlig019180g2 [Macrostomum lignano]|uniref:Rho-GAP domain-containing protein n=1 Tax=Macrostomum lignano TaxID=282301 RepID=A0A267FY82_9PLAT|nr:hypothetical protein BOX15_Mlig019180g2 [Macrostomum lignano]
MLRRLHPASHRVNPISEDFDSSVQLVRLKLSEHQQHHQQLSSLRAEFSPPEFQRRASGGSASLTVSDPDVDAMMADIDMMSSPSPKFLARRQQQQQQRQRRSSGADLPVAEDSRLVSTPVLSSTIAGCCGDDGALHRSAVQPDAASACLDELRQIRPRRFYEICRVNLAFVTDVPADFLQDVIDSCPPPQSSGAPMSATARRTPSAAGGLLVRVCRSVRQHSGAGQPHASAVSADAAAAAQNDDFLNADILTGVQRLIHLLESRLDAEGIFRKSGQVSRQRQLRRRLFPAAQQDLPASQSVAEAVVSELGCCVHDIAGVLKACLDDLKQPLLTDRLGPYFLQVADLNPQRLDENGNPLCPVEKPGGSVSLAAARQLRGFQILVQLLPHSNRWMLSSLLKLLGQVAELPRTLMTPENLGTVFGPLLLCPRQMKSTDDYARIIALSNRAVTYMIRHAGELFKVPEHLVIDAMRSLSTERSRCYSRSRSCSREADEVLDADADSDDDNDEAVDVCMNFVDRSTASRLGGRDYTQLQVAQLYAAVQAMPESAKKSALVRKFSAAANSVVVDPTTVAAPIDCGGASPRCRSPDGRHSRRRLCGQ